jgi:hypothetical protein
MALSLFESSVVTNNEDIAADAQNIIENFY